MLLAACDRGGDEASVDEAPRPQPAAVAPVTKADAERMLRERAIAGLRAILPDPDEARFAELRAGAAGGVCGQIDTEQPDGKRSGFRPFVVTPEGVAIISLTSQLNLDDPEDLFPDYYIRWCASPAELSTLRITNTLDTTIPVTELPEDLAEAADLPPPVEPGNIAAPVAAAPAAPTAPTPSGDLESFSKAVLRGPGKEESR